MINLAFPGGVAPGIGWTGPGQVLFAATAINATSGGFRDIQSGALGTPGGSGTLSGGLNATVGPWTYTAPTRTLAYAGRSTLGGSSGVTFATIGAPNGNWTSQQRHFFKASTLADNAPNFFSLTSGVIGVTAGFSATSTITLPTAPVFIMISSNFAANIVNFLILNLLTGAVQTQAVSGAGATWTAGNGSFSIGDVAGGAGLAALMSSFMFVNAPTSLAAMQQMAQDPWSLWYPEGVATLPPKGV